MAKIYKPTDPMFYILLVLQWKCEGREVRERIEDLTNGEVTVGIRTLYDLLKRFSEEGSILKLERNWVINSYIITDYGREILRHGYELRKKQVEYYEMIEERKSEKECAEPSQDEIKLYSEAVDNAFTQQEMNGIVSLLKEVPEEKLPRYVDGSLAGRRYLYLVRKYCAMAIHAEQKQVTDRFAYLCKEITREIESR